MLMMLTEPGVTPSPALATTSSLRVGAKSAPEWRDGFGVRNRGVGGVEQVGLRVDDGDVVAAFVQDEGAPEVGGHHAVDGSHADGDWGLVDGVAGGLDGVDLTIAAVIRLADRIDARGTGDTCDIDRAVGVIDGELLAEVERRALELCDGVAAEGRSDDGIAGVAAGLGKVGKKAPPGKRLRGRTPPLSSRVVCRIVLLRSEVST